MRLDKVIDDLVDTSDTLEQAQRKLRCMFDTDAHTTPTRILVHSYVVRWHWRKRPMRLRLVKSA